MVINNQQQKNVIIESKSLQQFNTLIRFIAFDKSLLIWFIPFFNSDYFSQIKYLKCYYNAILGTY